MRSNVPEKFDEFLKQNLRSVPSPGIYHEQKMLELIAKESSLTHSKSWKAMNTAWVSGFLAAASLLLYLGTCTNEGRKITNQSASDSFGKHSPDLAAVSILIDSMDDLNEMVATVPGSYIDDEFAD